MLGKSVSEVGRVGARPMDVEFNERSGEVTVTCPSCAASVQCVPIPGVVQSHNIEHEFDCEWLALEVTR